MCLQRFKTDVSFEVVLQNNAFVKGTLCNYVDDSGKPVSVIAVVHVYVRRGKDGSIREGWICLSEKGYLFTTPAFGLVPKYGRAGQKTHGLMAIANGARANFHLAGVHTKRRQEAKEAFIDFHYDNFEQDIASMHSTQLCPMRLCSASGRRLKGRSKLGEVFEVFNQAFADGKSSGLCPPARLDKQTPPNILWGFLEHDNNKPTGILVEGLNPFGEEDSGDEEGDEAGAGGAGDSDEEEDDSEESVEEGRGRGGGRAASGADGKGLMCKSNDRDTMAELKLPTNRVHPPTYPVPETVNLSEPEPRAVNR